MTRYRSGSCALYQHVNLISLSQVNILALRDGNVFVQKLDNVSLWDTDQSLIRSYAITPVNLASRDTAGAEVGASREIMLLMRVYDQQLIECYLIYDLKVSVVIIKIRFISVYLRTF